MMETFLPLLGYVVVSACTPGPNNLMVLQSGANFGVARTVPHILGIAVGFPVMIVAIGLGLEYAFQAFPPLHTIIKWASFVYLLWLAWKIGSAGRPHAEAADGRPVTFLQAAAFQWINPKGWAMSVGALALFTTAHGNPVIETGIVALLFGLVCIPNGFVWTLFGRSIAGFLQDDRKRLLFNIGMAVLLVLSVIPTLFE